MWLWYVSFVLSMKNTLGFWLEKCYSNRIIIVITYALHINDYTWMCMYLNVCTCICPCRFTQYLSNNQGNCVSETIVIYLFMPYFARSFYTLTKYWLDLINDYWGKYSVFQLSCIFLPSYHMEEMLLRQQKNNYSNHTE